MTATQALSTTNNFSANHSNVTYPLLNNLQHSSKPSAVLYSSLIPGFDHSETKDKNAAEGKSINDSIHNQQVHGSVGGGMSDWQQIQQQQQLIAEDKQTESRNGIPKVEKISIFVNEIVMQIDQNNAERSLGLK